MKEFEFNGYLTGKAEKFLHKKDLAFGRNCYIFALLFFLPLVVYFFLKTQSLPIIIGYCVLIGIVPLMKFIPQSEKEKRQLTPYLIYVEDGYIISKSEKNEEYRALQDVEEVYDHREFYELKFPFGKVSNNFICQKSLLIKGTLEDFEALFEDKIIREEQ